MGVGVDAVAGGGGAGDNVGEGRAGGSEGVVTFV